jgi:hypothetical protein
MVIKDGTGKDMEEAVVAKFKILSRHLPGGTKENYENPVRTAGLRDLQNTEQEFQPLNHDIR